MNDEGLTTKAHGLWLSFLIGSYVAAATCILLKKVGML